MPKLKTKIDERIRELVKIGTWHDNLPGTIETLGMPPIHLEHILMAIEKVGKWYIISSRGKFADVNRYSEYGEWAEKYDLSQPFSNQSQEFYEFLWSIITPQ